MSSRRLSNKGSSDVDRHHERPADPQEEANLPLESKDGARRDLSHPVGEPDPAADADPYAPPPADDQAQTPDH